jgi:hypothetical protein
LIEREWKPQMPPNRTSLRKPLLPGKYVARLVRCEAFSSQYGPAARLTFDVDGREVSRVFKAECPNKAKCTNRNAAGRMVAGILGRQMEPGESVDLQPFINKPFLITVEHPSGFKVRVADNPPPSPTT